MRGFAASLLLTLVLAGCSGGGSEGESGGDPFGEESFEELDLKATEDTGVLRGVVIDEAIVPIDAALVNITGPGGYVSNVTTKANGAFGLDGLEPGDYFLVASKAGYKEIQVTATVVANVADPAAVKIMLPVDPAAEPYPRQYVLEGFMTCSARIMLTAVPAGECRSSDNSQSFEELDRIPDWIQSEMTWDSTQALGDAMSLVSECFSGDAEDPDPCPDGNLVVNRSEGSSPLIIMVNHTLATTFRIGDGGPEGAGNPYNLRVFAAGREDTDVIKEEQNNQMLNSTTGGAVQCVAWPAINEGCFRFTGVGVILNQQFMVYTTVFYGYTPPEGWLFSNGEPVPQPA